MTKTETDVDKIAAFCNGMTGEETHKEMLGAMIKGKVMQIRTVEHMDKIIALRLFAKVLNPVGMKQGWALVQDLANGNEIEPEIT
jgi:hypothetical protein